MTAQTERLRERYEGAGFRWAFWQVALWAIGIGAALAVAVLLTLVLVPTPTSGGVVTDGVLWVSMVLWTLLLGAAAGLVMAVLALILRALAHGGAPVLLLRSLLGVVAGATTTAVLTWLSASIPLLVAIALAVGVGLGWVAQWGTFARRRPVAPEGERA